MIDINEDMFYFYLIYFHHMVAILHEWDLGFVLFLFLFFTLAAATYLLWRNMSQITIASLIAIFISNYIWKVPQKIYLGIGNVQICSGCCNKIL